MNKFFKFLLRFFGGILLNLSLTIFILSFFASYSLDNIGVFESSLKSTVYEELNINETQQQEIENLCRLNPNSPGCEQSNQFTTYINGIVDYKADIINIRILSVIFFFIGILLIYFVHSDLIITFYKVGLSGLITSILSILYLTLLPSILKGIFNGEYIRTFARDVPSEMFNKLIEVIIIWLNVPLNRTLKISIILSIIFLILTVVFYILKKRKALKNKDIKNKNDGKKQGSNT
ncbi:MAG: hypothetical protein V1663_03975 [archaeon]